MADLSSNPLKNVVESILNLASGAITGSLKVVQDGEGNATALQVSSAGVKSSGTLESAGNATIGGDLTATNISGSGTGITDTMGGTQSNTAADISSVDYDMQTDDVVLIVSGSTGDVNLVDAVEFGAGFLFIKDTSSVGFTVNRATSDTIDGSTTLAVGADEGFILYCDGVASWHIMAKFT